MLVSIGIHIYAILLTKTTAAQNVATLSYHRLRGLYFLAVVFVRSICVRSYQTIRTGDRECPLATKGNIFNEQFRMAHEDPMYHMCRQEVCVCRLSVYRQLRAWIIEPNSNNCPTRNCWPSIVRRAFVVLRYMLYAISKD